MVWVILTAQTFYILWLLTALVLNLLQPTRELVGSRISPTSGSEGLGRVDGGAAIDATGPTRIADDTAHAPISRGMSPLTQECAQVSSKSQLQSQEPSPAPVYAQGVYPL
jgi:hypothetical protein